MLLQKFAVHCKYIYMTIKKGLKAYSKKLFMFIMLIIGGKITNNINHVKNRILRLSYMW